MLVRGQAQVQEPDPGHAVDISLGHTGYRLRSGHRLRVHLACSDYPLYIWHTTRGQRNEQTLITGSREVAHEVVQKRHMPRGALHPAGRSGAADIGPGAVSAGCHSAPDSAKPGGLSCYSVVH